jgi:sulfite reductase beta subunit-like hemoprotein
VPAEQAADYVERLVGAYLEERTLGETFQAYAQRKSDEDLTAIATGQPAPAAAD